VRPRYEAQVSDLNHGRYLPPDNQPVGPVGGSYVEPPDLRRLPQVPFDDRVAGCARIGTHNRRIVRQLLQRSLEPTADLAGPQALVSLPGSRRKIEKPACQSLSGLSRIIRSG